MAGRLPIAARGGFRHLSCLSYVLILQAKDVRHQLMLCYVVVKPVVHAYSVAYLAFIVVLFALFPQLSCQ